ncbi:hypothetical protein B4135_0362 [Caldibacillus debilis]|uniref:Uncharacterized protein n=1 Tax=Caldibacillus debilis TaxID=301148 RepID=A0A150LK59_9BACI|nr:hypothetical protein B4135_0362 [Caldibacillus debilis]
MVYDNEKSNFPDRSRKIDIPCFSSFGIFRVPLQACHNRNSINCGCN